MKDYFPPKEKSYTYLQTNRSDVLGSLWSTFNLDFQSNLGVMRLAQKLVTVTTSVDDADLGVPSAFEFFDGGWWAICGTRVFRDLFEDIYSGFTEDTSTNAQTNYDTFYSDFGVFDARLWSTTSDKLFSKAGIADGDAWVQRDSFTSATLHKLAYLKKFNRLYYVATGTTIRSIDTTNVVASSGDYFIDLGTSNGRITTIVSDSQNIWIGMLEPVNGTPSTGTVGTILQWDGISAQVTNEFKVTAGAILAMTVLNTVPYAVDSEGRVLKYSGFAFEEVGRLPVNRTLLAGATRITITDGRFVHFNGLTATKNNTLLISVKNLNGDNGATINENLPSGIWELDLATGNFTHRYSFTYKPYSSSTITDFGQNKVTQVGAIKVNPMTSTFSAGRATIVAGAKVYTDATSTRSAIFADSAASPDTDTEGQKRGYFVTDWFNSSEIESKWGRLWMTHRRFLNSTDKAVFKYRLNEEDPVYATITWTSTTTFTTTTDVSAYGPTASGFNGTTGGEVEVIQGTGGGSCTHILSVVNNGGTYTVTLDDTVTGATGTAKVRLQKWIKLFPEVTGQVKSWEQMAIGGNNIRIQVKGVLVWTGNGEFYKAAIFSNEDIKITA